LRLPERFLWHKRLYLASLCRASVLKARRVIAVSRQTAADVRSHFGVDSRRVEVVYNGVGGKFRPLPAEEATAFRQRMGLPPRFLLYLGTLEPRKNLSHLLRAYAGWQADSATGREVALVLAGAKGWHYQDIFRLVAELGLTGQVHAPGFVPEQELCLLYNAAGGFVYPSLFEGFGLPVLEAMASGTPVICSDAPSLQEVAADAALIVPAQDQPALQDAFERLFTEQSLAAQLRDRGIRQAGRFSWERAAAETIDVYEAALNRG
jgi:glycosyltransferase involved in cell wall biosynthesis